GGPRAGDYANYRIKRIVDDFPILRMNFYDYPFPDGEWLAYAYTDNYIWYYGPVAKRLGIEGQMFKGNSNHDHNITHIHNKIVVKLDDGASVYFAGEGAQWLGLEGKLFERADLPIELENGNIIHKVSSDQDYIEIMVYRFNNSTSPLIPQGESFIKIKRSLHYENEIRIFSQSGWAVNNVYYENGVGFAGELNDPDLEAVRVKSWTDLGTIREAPDGRLFVRITAYDPQKNRYFDEMKGAWAQNAGEYIKYKNSSTYAYFANADLTKEAFLVALTPIFFTSDQWVMKVITTGGERWIVTSNILLKYFDNSRLDHVFTILKVYRTKDGRWLARVKYENTEERYIGPLVAELPELRYAYGEEVEGLDLPEIYEKSLVQVAFTRNEDGTIDPEQYAVTYNYKNEEGVMVCKCLGPLAEAFGKDKIDFSGSVEFGHTVNGDVIVDSYMSGSVLSLNSWNYLSRTAAMYGIDQPEGSGVIPQRRIDLRWANFYSRFLKHKQGFESIRRGWEIVELIKEFRSLAAYMKNNISARYFDVKAVEEVVR
ncbi:MAG: hypothetical protein KAR20_27185, partial [Candidatus Heimdallarchaeota archaeon]|nr:hypothetical protein [Candidatus Heimdallarchaeota archaeon]